MLPQEIIRRKRDGHPLLTVEIRQFIAGVAAGVVTDAQIAALTMAVFCRKLDSNERLALTMAMRDSGAVLQWDCRPVVDKHSTGGVGDKTSLILAPLVAACGGYVPMIAGRGLGHAGGTIDKLDSIPGYDTGLTIAAFQAQVRQIGCSIIRQTSELAPADGRLYTVRDTVGTVESLDLITASILSKKLAAGLGSLVMDVKFGSGAYMAEYGEARALAESIVTVANGAGVKTVAYLTDMNQVLGRNAGNALEVLECMDWLTGQSPEPRLQELTLTLAAEMLVGAGLAADMADGRRKCEAALASGRAAEKFAAMVAAQGGPSDLLEKPYLYLPATPVVRAIPSLVDGYVTRMDVRQLGLAIIGMKGGRTAPGEKIDFAVGFSAVTGLGERVSTGQPLALVHGRSADMAEQAAKTFLAAVTIEPAPVSPQPLVRERLAG